MSIDLSEKIEIAVTMCADGRLSDAQFRVGVALVLYFHNTKTGACFPSYRQLAEASHTSQGTVLRAIKALEKAEWIVAERSDGGRNKRNAYTIKHSTGGAFEDENTPLAEQKHSTGGAPCSTGGARNTPLVIDAYIQEGNPGTNPGRTTGSKRDAFEQWWSLCPRKRDKKKAGDLYRRIIAKREATEEQLFQGISRYRAEVVSKGTEPRFVKHPATWLRNGCWTDEPEYPAKGSDRNSRSLAAGFFEEFEQ